MAILNKGQTFSDGEQVTSAKLNTAVDGATFASGAVDDVSTQLSGGAIIVKDGGVGTAKIADSNVTTAKIADSNVTTAKLADSSVVFAKLDNVIDDDTMATASATTLATSESIKAYVDGGFSPTNYTGGESVTFPNGLIMKWGVVNIPAGGSTVSFGTAFPNNCINVITSAHGADALAGSAGITAFSTSGFSANPKYGQDFHWQAIGY